MFANLVPGKAFAVAGPWWFFSFIFQVYLVFPLILWFWSRMGTKGLLGLVILGYLLTIGLYDPIRSVNLNPYMMVIGHLPEVCLGIFLAKKGTLRLPGWVILLSFLLVAGGNYLSWIWPFANLGVSILLVVVIQWFMRLTEPHKTVRQVVVFIGSVSMYLFILQGFVRNPFIAMATGMGAPVPAFLIGLLFLLVATGLAYLMESADRSVRRWIGQAPAKPRKVLRAGVVALTVAGPVGALLLVRGILAGENTGTQHETIVFQVTNPFETENPNYPGRYTDTIHYGGKMAFILPHDQTFSPPLEADFSKIDLKGVYEADASVKLYTQDSLSSGHLIIEIWDVRSGQRLEWSSRYLKPGEFVTGKWFTCSYTYPLQGVYLHSNYKLKVYLWNVGKGLYYADDLELIIKARE